MTVYKIKNITKTLTLDDELISTKETDGYVLIPDQGKLLKNKLTGVITSHNVYIYQRVAINDYIEIDIPKEKEN